MVTALGNLKRAGRQTSFNEGIGRVQIPGASRNKWLNQIESLDFPGTQESAEWHRFEQRAYWAAEQNIGSYVREALQLLLDQNGVDVLVIENLPHVAPGLAPTDGTRPVGKSATSEAVLIGLANAAGLEVFGYLQEKNGSLIHEVAPEAGKENTQSNYGRTLFSYHVDNACFGDQYQPEFLFLLGLINEGGVVTRLLRLQPDVLSNIPAPLLRTLRKPIFRFAAPQSFDFGGFVLASPLRAVIYDDEFGVPNIAWPSRPYRQDCDEAQTAMTEFQALLNSLAPQRIVVDPGVIVAFRNSRVLHGREEIPATSERWLQRIYACRSLAAHRQATRANGSARVFDARLLVMK